MFSGSAYSVLYSRVYSSLLFLSHQRAERCYSDTVLMKKTEGCHAFPALQASLCSNSVCLETETCKKGAKKTENGFGSIPPRFGVVHCNKAQPQGHDTYMPLEKKATPCDPYWQDITWNIHSAKTFIGSYFASIKGNPCDGGDHASNLVAESGRRKVLSA